jgi:hypothetical protein
VVGVTFHRFINNNEAVTRYLGSLDEIDISTAGMSHGKASWLKIAAIANIPPRAESLSKLTGNKEEIMKV